MDEKFFKNGTINIDISPKEYSIIEPDYEFNDFEWCPRFKEDFKFVKLKFVFKDKEYEGFLYSPSKTPNPRNIMEIVSEKIPKISNGENVKLIFPDEKINF